MSTGRTKKEQLRVHIRWMIRRDMPEVLQTEQESFEYSWTEEDFLRCLRQRNCIGMMAEQGEKVIGFMIYELHKSKLHIMNFAVLPAYAPDAQARVHVFCHAVPGTWHAMGVMLSAAGSLAWLRRAVGVDYDVLDQEAARWAPGTEGLLFAPYLAGERTPHADPDARGAFTGLSLRHDRGALARATLEGVAYGLRDSLELLRALGVRPEVGRASGGGATSDLWLRIVASVLALPLERTESEEGSAFGAALLAGVRAGVFDDADDAVVRCVRVRNRVEPDPAWSAAYERGYDRYRLLYPTLRPLEEP